MILGVGDTVKSNDSFVLEFSKNGWFEIKDIYFDITNSHVSVRGKNMPWVSYQTIVAAKTRHGDYWKKDLS